MRRRGGRAPEFVNRDDLELDFLALLQDACTPALERLNLGPGSANREMSTGYRIVRARRQVALPGQFGAVEEEAEVLITPSSRRVDSRILRAKRLLCEIIQIFLMHF